MHRLLTPAIVAAPIVAASVALIPGAASANLLSAFDRVSVVVVDGEEYGSARGGVDEGFLIGSDGRLFVPRLGSFQAAGRREADLEGEIGRRLSEYLRVPSVSVRLVAASPIAVEVSGAVYRPGPVTLAPENPTQANVLRDAATLRTVFQAVRRAGGIRPDADLAGIALVRNGLRRPLAVGEDAPLIAGDYIEVPSLGTGNHEARNVPSQLAPEEITVYVSGQDLPRAGAVRVRPGTRLSGALAAAGAAGEAVMRSGRRVTLLRRGGQGSAGQGGPGQGGPGQGGPGQGGPGRADSYALDAVMRGEYDPKLEQDDAIAIDAGTTANTAGVLGFLTPLFAPFLFLLGR